jgi:dTDP-4-amino-4,6-dideoxygalactose transaminase
VGPGDEVIVAPFTYIATIDAILLSYALPVFADSDLKTFQIDPDDIERRITEHTRAILPVHLLGGAANMDKILAVAEKHKLPVIEDACQAHMVEWRGKKLGTLGTIGCFSFQESKNLPAGEAGALVSNDADLIAKAYSFRDFGRDPKHTNSYLIRGTKYRSSDFAAAVLMAQLTRFDDLCLTREKNGAYLREEIKKIPGILPQENYPGLTRHNHYFFGFRYDQAQFSGLSISRFVEAINAEGIPVGPVYPPMNKEPYVEDNLKSRGFRTVFSAERLDRYRKQNHCPHNDELCATSLCIFQNTLLGTKSDVDDIVEAFHKVHKNAASL